MDRTVLSAVRNCACRRIIFRKLNRWTVHHAVVRCLGKQIMQFGVPTGTSYGGIESVCLYIRCYIHFKE